MSKRTKAHKLADAAAYLCSAYDDLAAAGYQEWSDELRRLIDIMSAEIAWLEPPTKRELRAS